MDKQVFLDLIFGLSLLCSPACSSACAPIIVSADTAICRCHNPRKCLVRPTINGGKWFLELRDMLDILLPDLFLKLYYVVAAMEQLFATFPGTTTGNEPLLRGFWGNLLKILVEVESFYQHGIYLCTVEKSVGQINYDDLLRNALSQRKGYAEFKKEVPFLPTLYILATTGYCSRTDGRFYAEASRALSLNIEAVIPVAYGMHLKVLRKRAEYFAAHENLCTALFSSLSPGAPRVLLSDFFGTRPF